MLKNILNTNVLLIIQSINFSFTNNKNCTVKYSSPSTSLLQLEYVTSHMYNLHNHDSRPCFFKMGYQGWPTVDMLIILLPV